MAPEINIILNDGYTRIDKKPSVPFTLAREGKTPPPFKGKSPGIFTSEPVEIVPNSEDEKSSHFTLISGPHWKDKEAFVNFVHTGDDISETLPKAVSLQPGESLTFSRGKIIHGKIESSENKDQNSSPTQK